MPTVVPIKIFKIAETKVNELAVRKWLDFLGVSDDFLEATENVTDPALLVALAAKRCYKSFEVGLNPNVTQIRKDYTEYLDNVMKSGHGSVLEHAVFTFAIENVSRVFTAEMNRHRAGWAISEGSLRFIRYGENIPYWLPMCLETQARDDTDLARRKARSQDVFQLAFKDQEVRYRQLEDIWNLKEGDHNFAYKKIVTSMMRRIIGMGVATGGVWTGNARAVRHVLAMRCSAAAEEEILHVFSRVVVHMRETEPMLFGDFYQDENGFWRPKYVKV